MSTLCLHGKRPDSQLLASEDTQVIRLVGRWSELSDRIRPTIFALALAPVLFMSNPSVHIRDKTIKSLTEAESPVLDMRIHIDYIEPNRQAVTAAI